MTKYWGWCEACNYLTSDSIDATERPAAGGCGECGGVDTMQSVTYHQKYYRQNQAKIQANITTYRENNADKLKEYGKKYYRKTADKQKEKVANWRKKNPEKVREAGRRSYEKNREARATKRAENREAINAAQRERRARAKAEQAEQSPA